MMSHTLLTFLDSYLELYSVFDSLIKKVVVVMFHFNHWKVSFKSVLLPVLFIGSTLILISCNGNDEKISENKEDFRLVNCIAGKYSTDLNNKTFLDTDVIVSIQSNHESAPTQMIVLVEQKDNPANRFCSHYTIKNVTKNGSAITLQNLKDGNHKGRVEEAVAIHPEIQFTYVAAQQSSQLSSQAANTTNQQNQAGYQANAQAQAGGQQGQQPQGTQANATNQEGANNQSQEFKCGSSSNIQLSYVYAEETEATPSTSDADAEKPAKEQPKPVVKKMEPLVQDSSEVGAWNSLLNLCR